MRIVYSNQLTKCVVGAGGFYSVGLLGDAADELHFFYDTQTRPTFVDYKGTKYTYVLNLQGDVVALLDSNGKTLVEYKYDAWGKPLSTTGTMAATLGRLNPFRYRGYIYDEETGLYYLRSRYYSPTWERFINADGLDILERTVGRHFGGNLFQYCKNACPISLDEDGNWLNIVVGAIAGAAISAGFQIVSNIASGKGAMDGVLTAAASGAITGGVAASGAGVMAQIVTGAAVGAGAEFAQQMIDSGGDVDPLTCFIDCTISGFAGGFGGYFGGKGLVHYKGDAYKQGIRLLNVMRNIERGIYSSQGKAMKRLIKVGGEYVKTYAKEAMIAAAKYTACTIGFGLAKSYAQEGMHKLLGREKYSTFRPIAMM